MNGHHHNPLPGLKITMFVLQLEKTRFPFHLPHHEASRPDEVGVDQRKSDDDGDLDIIRRPQSINDVLILGEIVASAWCVGDLFVRLCCASSDIATQGITYIVGCVS